MSIGPAIDARGIARQFGANWVLRGASLTVHAGEVVSLLGANGSGKSTFLRVVAAALRPSAGTVQVFDRDVVRDADDVRAIISYLGHAPGLYDDLTARENLRFAAVMLDRGVDAVDACLERVGLRHVAGERVRGFSSGMQRRLAIGRVLLARPRLLLLDEPYSNLDDNGVALMNDVIGQHVQGGGAALLVVHELAPAMRVIDRTVSLVDGRIVAGADPGADVRPARERTSPVHLVASGR